MMHQIILVKLGSHFSKKTRKSQLSCGFEELDHTRRNRLLLVIHPRTPSANIGLAAVCSAKFLSTFSGCDLGCRVCVCLASFLVLLVHQDDRRMAYCEASMWQLCQKPCTKKFGIGTVPNDEAGRCTNGP